MVVHQSDSKQKDMTRFIDYFFMCGLCDSKQPKIYKFFEESSGVKDQRLVSSVLCHFPKNIPDNPWKSAELWKLCTPFGIGVHFGETKPTQLHSHSFLITREDGSKMYGHVLAFYEQCINPEQKDQIADLLQLDMDLTNHNVYVEKCIGFITQLALISTCEKVLQTLFKLFMFDSSMKTPATRGNLPIESYIYNLLYEVPLLSPGGSLKLSCMGHEDPVIIQQPPISELPLLDIYLSEVYRLVGGVRNLLNLLTSLLFEHQILLVSEDSRKLAVVAEGMTSLLFPFQWQHTQVSVLPYDLAMHFFDAPVPYLIGVVVLPGQKELIRQALEVNQCYADLDKAVVESPEDQPSFPNQMDILNQIDWFWKTYKGEVISASRHNKVGNAEQSKPSDAFVGVQRSEEPSADGERKFDFSHLHVNEAVSQVANIAKKVGVISSLDDIDHLHVNIGGSGKLGARLQVSPRVLSEQKFNICLRETIASAFMSIFLHYDKFMIFPSLDESGMWTFSTEAQDNFDKTSFLSDQPESRLRFLLSFLDTQMFATFVDNSIMAHQPQQGDFIKDAFVRLFDDRIDQSKNPIEPRSPASPATPTPAILRSISVSSNNIASPYSETWMKDAETSVEKRLSQVDIVSCFPHPVHKGLDEDISGLTIMNAPETFPIIRGSLLESEGFETKKRHLRRQNDSRAAFKKQSSVRDSKWKRIQEARNNLLRQPSMSEYSPELIARTNWMFVEKLLKDVKHKTKKILVGKMGKEAIELGHGELSASVTNLEENTWIASLCDLLERVWSHGLLTNYKKGKSALWSHLLQYQFEEEDKARKRSMLLQQFSGSSPSLAVESPAEEPQSNSSFDATTSYYSLPRSFPRRKRPDFPRKTPSEVAHQNNSTSSPSSHRCISHLSYSILSSMERIQSMREIQSEVGRSRAWIRLALEQKQLHTYLRQLLLDHNLLDRMYKKYSLLQCDDQREQFLYHLLSLEAADFTCFTNSFPKTKIEYRVCIVPGRQFAGASQTSANVYLWICGEQCKTEKILVPKGCLEFSFKHQNLGVMSTLTIGHDNAGMLPKWLLAYIIVQNQVTGQPWCFPCRRWLGKGVDDNSLERLLVADVVPRNHDIVNFANNISHRNSASLSTSIPELQEKVGQAVNNIVKYCLKPDREHRADVAPPPTACITKLVWNVVMALECVFTHGFRPGGLFKRRLFALDVIAAGFEDFRDNVQKHSLIIQDSPPPHAPLPPNNIAPGGDWFLGSRRTSAAGIGPNKRSKDGYDSRRDANDIVKSSAMLAKERVAFARLCQLYQQISGASPRLGKDDIFHLLICIGIQEHSLPLWLPTLSDVAQNAQNIYEDSAFLCDRSAVIFLGQVLNILLEYNIPLHSSLLRGHDDMISFNLDK